MEKVLVTGASGYIALHCINELLKEGYKVKGSLRDLKREDEVRKSLNPELKYENIEFCQLNLLEDKGWENAASDCDYLLHIASPCFIEEPKDEKEMIEPARQGTLRALKAAQESNIKKVVLTASIGSIAYGHKKIICNTNDWTDISQDVGAYIKSKTIAERAAWEFLNKQSKVSFKMTTIHPGMVFGPLLNNNLSGISASLISKMIEGKFPALPNIYFTVVDVRDIAQLHVKSLKNEESNNKRIIATSEEGMPFVEISMMLRDLGYTKSPKNIIPSKIINSLAAFNKGMKTTALMIERGQYGADISETISMFNWNPIPFKKTLEDMTHSLKKFKNN